MKIKENYDKIEHLERSNTESISNDKLKCPHCKNPLEIAKGTYINRRDLSKCYMCYKDIAVVVTHTITLNLDVKIKKVG